MAFSGTDVETGLFIFPQCVKAGRSFFLKKSLPDQNAQTRLDVQPLLTGFCSAGASCGSVIRGNDSEMAV